MSERVQKYLAREGYGSRRQIESWLSAGKITTDHQTLQLGDQVQVGDTIYVEGQQVKVREVRSLPRLLAYHKGEGEICTRKDPKARRLVFDSLPTIEDGRWLSVGRLDINTTGLMLFSNDGGLVHALMHPSNEIEREYLCRVFGTVSNNDLSRLCEGVRSEKDVLRFKKVSRIEGSGRNHWFRIVLAGGKNREIRRAWQTLDCQVNRLKRIRYGFYHLPPDLKIGQWLELDAQQVRKFRNLCVSLDQGGRK